MTEISDYDMSLTCQSWKWLLNEKTSLKGSESFDVLVGRFLGIKVCDLVGIFILNKLKNVSQSSTFGLYIDETLAIVKGLSDLKI